MAEFKTGTSKLTRWPDAGEYAGRFGGAGLALSVLAPSQIHWRVRVGEQFNCLPPHCRHPGRASISELRAPPSSSAPRMPPVARPLWPAMSSGWAPLPFSSSRGLPRSRVPTSPLTASPRSTQSSAPNKRRRYGHCAPTYPRDSPPSSTGACSGTRSTVTRTQQRCSMTSFGTVSSRPGRTPCDALTRATSLRRVRWVPSQAGAGTCRAQD